MAHHLTEAAAYTMPNVPLARETFANLALASRVAEAAVRCSSTTCIRMQTTAGTRKRRRVRVLACTMRVHRAWMFTDAVFRNSAHTISTAMYVLRAC